MPCHFLWITEGTEVVGFLALRTQLNEWLLEQLVVYDEENVPSARTIEACGGLQEDVRHGHRRYWIETGG